MKKITLRLLIVTAVLAVGIAGSTAYFSDTETSTGNVFTAGAIDLKVDNVSHYNGYICDGQVWQCEPWADFVVAFDQGKRKDGSDVLPERSDPAKALGPAQSTGAPSDSPVIPGSFVSLGFKLGLDGTITVGFNNKILNGPGMDLKIYEVTGGSYPDEKVEVEVSQDGINFFPADPFIITRDGEVDLGTLAWAKYVRLTDVSDQDLFEPTADGYDLDAIEALHCASDPLELEGTDCYLTWEPQDLGMGDNDSYVARKFFDFIDIKPGDRGESTISLHLSSNPAYACMHFSNLINDENGYTEPEIGFDNNPDVGNLGETMMFLLWEDDGNNIWEDGEKVIAGPLTANEIMDNMSYPLALSPDPWQPEEVRYVGMAWCAGTMVVNETINSILCDPSGMGNEAQTDKMLVDIGFYVEQARHNDGFVCRQPADNSNGLIDTDDY